MHEVLSDNLPYALVSSACGDDRWGWLAECVSLKEVKKIAIACGGSPVPTSYPKRRHDFMTFRMGFIVHDTNFLWENRTNSCPSDRNIATCR